MKRALFLLFIGITSVGCRRIPSPSYTNDCRLFPVSFDNPVFFNDSLMDDSFKGYYSEIENGVFYKIHYGGQERPLTVRAFEIKGDKVCLIDILNSKQISFSVEKARIFESLFGNVEKGNYVQFCSRTRSEAPVSILLIKSGGRVIFRYESIDYEYTYLNKDAQEMIKSALALLDLLVNTNE